MRMSVQMPYCLLICIFYKPSYTEREGVTVGVGVGVLVGVTVVVGVGVILEGVGVGVGGNGPLSTIVIELV